MSLTKVERRILANQYKILEIIDPDYSDEHKASREAFQSGFEALYRDLIDDSKDGLTADECVEVSDILKMFDQIGYQEELIAELEGSACQLRFGGFSAAEENPQYGYVQFIIKEAKRKEEEKYPRALNRASFDAHGPMLPVYRDKLEVWNEIRRRFLQGGSLELTREEMERIGRAGHPPRGPRILFV